MANNMNCSTQTDIRSVSNLEEMASDMPFVVQCTVDRSCSEVVSATTTDQCGHNPSWI